MTQTAAFPLVCCMVALTLTLTLTLTLASAQLASPKAFLDAHNAARRSAGVGRVKWDKGMENYAKKYAATRAEDCLLRHSGAVSYGENIFWGNGKDFSAADAVGLWVAEKKWYRYSSNACDAGRVCGHYTQVVWRSTAWIGCAKTKCKGNLGEFIICDYYPRGNDPRLRPY